MHIVTSCIPAARMAPKSRLDMIIPNLPHILHRPRPKLRTLEGKLSGDKVYIAEYPIVVNPQIAEETAISVQKFIAINKMKVAKPPIIYPSPVLQFRPSLVSISHAARNIMGKSTTSFKSNRMQISKLEIDCPLLFSTIIGKNTLSANPTETVNQARLSFTVVYCYGGEQQILKSSELVSVLLTKGVEASKKMWLSMSISTSLVLAIFIRTYTASSCFPTENSCLAVSSMNMRIISAIIQHTSINPIRNLKINIDSTERAFSMSPRMIIIVAPTAQKIVKNVKTHRFDSGKLSVNIEAVFVTSPPQPAPTANAAMQIMIIFTEHIIIIVKTMYTTAQILQANIRPQRSDMPPNSTEPRSMPADTRDPAIPASNGLMSHAVVSSREIRAIPSHQNPTIIHARPQFTISQFQYFPQPISSKMLFMSILIINVITANFY